VAAAAAAQDGVLDLDEPVAATLDEFADGAWRRELRVRQLLDSTSGLESGVQGLVRDPVPDRYARSLELEMIAPPGERFQYGPGQLFVFGVLLARKHPDGADDPVAYLTRRIFDPLGIEVVEWSRDARGHPDLPSGAVLRARDWAKFGMLVRDRGRWLGHTLIDPEQMAACFQGSAVEPQYGLTFWLNVPDPPDAPPPRSAAAEARDADLFFPGGPEDLVVAAGRGNQRLYVIPSADLVVVRFGDPDRGWRDREFLARLMRGRSDRPEATKQTEAEPRTGRVVQRADEDTGAPSEP
jgi:CubicO group peptidase (beta-lactamase class C family)